MNAYFNGCKMIYLTCAQDSIIIHQPMNLYHQRSGKNTFSIFFPPVSWSLSFLFGMFLLNSIVSSAIDGSPSNYRQLLKIWLVKVWYCNLVSTLKVCLCTGLWGSQGNHNHRRERCAKTCFVARSDTILSVSWIRLCSSERPGTGWPAVCRLMA